MRTKIQYTVSELISTARSYGIFKVPCVLTVVHHRTELQTKIINRQCESAGYTALNLPLPPDNEPVEVTIRRITDFLNNKPSSDIKYIVVEGNYSNLGSHDPNFQLLDYLANLIGSARKLVITTSTSECLESILSDPKYRDVVNYQERGAFQLALMSKKPKSCCENLCWLFRFT